MNPVIESLRVIGALMVLTHHYTYQISGGLAASFFGLHFFHNGVDLFFVITGYLFAPFLLDEKNAASYKFLKRRFFRFYPLYLLSLITFTMSATAELPTLALWVEHLFLVQSLPYHTIAEADAVSLVYWTLATEFQFYLFVFLLSIFYSYVRIKNKLLLLIVLSLLGFLISSYSSYQPQNGAWILWQAQLPALLLEFTFGVLVFTYLPKITTAASKISLATLGIALLILLYHIYPQLTETSLTARPFAWFNILCALGYSCVLAALLAWHNSNNITSPKTKSIVIFLGGLSYAIYLFHEISIRWISNIFTNEGYIIMGAFFVTIALAIPINRWVEVPLREFGRR